jgi:hypothetical protein
MSEASNIQNGLVALAAKIKTLRQMITPGVNYDVSNLTTTAKTSLIAAINEVKAQANSIAASVSGISSTSITNEINSTVNAAISALVGGAPTALDTIAELATKAGDLEALVGARLRFDAAQTLTAPQKAQGCANLGAVPLADYGALGTDYVAAINTVLNS